MHLFNNEVFFSIASQSILMITMMIWSLLSFSQVESLLCILLKFIHFSVYRIDLMLNGEDISEDNMRKQRTIFYQQEIVENLCVLVINHLFFLSIGKSNHRTIDENSFITHINPQYSFKYRSTTISQFIIISFLS